MEGYKHFSHNHNLNHHQVPQGTQVTCSGCKSTATGNVFVCLPCNFYLHENCYQATRSLQHPSHPSHPLTLVPYPTYPTSSFYCNTCTLIGTGFSYSCSNCEFDIHIQCSFNTSHPNHTPSFIHNQSMHNRVLTPDAAPNAYVSHQTVNHYPIPYNPGFSAPSPPTDVYTSKAPTKAESTKPSKTGKRGGIMHFSHKHGLRLVNLNAEEDYIDCSGCEKVISGPAYSCTKSSCDFHLDNSCFQLAQEIRHKSHPHHPLTILSTPPYEYGHFTCNACSNDGCGFTYHCGACQFDLHVNCASLTETVKREDHQHPLQLIYSCPTKVAGNTFYCDVCLSDVPNDCWVYYCQECDFGCHTECVNSEASDAEDLADQLAAAQIEAKINADARQAALDLWDPPGTKYKYKYKYKYDDDDIWG